MEMDESGDLLDLSFLTGEEQQAIAEVLQRDNELKEKDEQRIRRLRSTLTDNCALKRLSGEWFCDVRASRPWGQRGGVDIVRASIRRKKKTRGEWDQNWGHDYTQVNGGHESEETDEDENWEPMARLDDEYPTQDLSSDIQDDESSKDDEENNETDFIVGRHRIPSEGEQDMEEISLSPVTVTVEEDTTKQVLNPESLPKGDGHRSLNYSPSVPTLGNKSLSGSMMSLFSAGEVHSLEVRGWIQFSIQYDPPKKELRILIIQCRDLTAAHSQTSNPYVKCYLLPDKSTQGKRKTKVKKKTLDPLFNETLKYKMERSELQGRFLNLSVWHRSSLGRKLFLGEVELDLASWDWRQTQPSWHNLQPRTPLSPDFLYSRGRLNIATKFIPQGSDGFGLPPSGELHIWVKEAQQLVPHKAGNVSAYVKCCVLPDDSPSSIQRTRVITHSLQPLFNHTMVYDGFRVEDLTEACVEFTVWDQGTLSSKPLGGIRLSTGRGSSYTLPVSWMDSTEQEKSFWESVINRSGEWIEDTLPLRQNLTPR
ncbi:synaptotagmin-like protein 1 [Spea bombifrons]|uniref:synaptotagmin-like protein 1 n=1 Tax=Spea bombifrons TaxID=233779 RepID=UPI00234A912A|nr:synaptotagmin-like protein 1 [Spea bombifrons]